LLEFSKIFRRGGRLVRCARERSGPDHVAAYRGQQGGALKPSRGLALTNKAQGLFLDRVLDNYEQALLRLERRAKGDYGPDELPKSFPKFTQQAQRPDSRRAQTRASHR
jgi:hypothetical protein